jgi:hypothetical protein
MRFTSRALCVKWKGAILLTMMNVWPDTQKGTRMSKDGGRERSSLRVPGAGSVREKAGLRILPASCEVVEGVVLRCLDARFWASSRTLELIDEQWES